MISGSSDRCEGTFAQDHIPQDTFRIGTFNTSIINDGTRRCRQSFSGIPLDLATLIDGGGTINIKIKWIIGRNSKTQGIGPEHGFGTKGRSNAGTSIGPTETDTSLITSHACVISGNSVVGRILASDKANAVLFGLVNGQLHTIGTNIQSQSQIAIDQGFLLLFNR